MNFKQSSIAILIGALMLPAQAESLDSAQKIQSKTNSASASSQKRVDKSAEAALTLEAEIAQLQEEVHNLKIYRDHLNGLVDSQSAEIANFNQQIEDIATTRQGVVPLMYHMLDGLKKIVENDKPIRFQQRQERIAKLDAMMTRADVADAEKYRRILEAYQIEMDYGTKLGVYQGQVTLASGSEIEADILYLGRVSLVARSLSGERYWTWDSSNRNWLELSAEQSSDLDKAYAMASKQIAPSMLTLPMSLTQAEGK